MTPPIRVAAVGLVHDHIWSNLDNLREDGRAVLVAACDDNEPLRRRAVDEYGARNVYANVQELLASETIDAILCGSENNRHADIVEAAAARGVHVMVEKPMAATFEQARRMAIAAERGKSMLMINWPTAWSPSINLACSLARDGRIGQPFYVKYHAGHNGALSIGLSEYFWEWLCDAEKNGPGALNDYCCYGANLSCYLLGKPLSVTGAGGRFLKTMDIPFDNAILLLQYAHAVAVAEASWSQIGHPPHYELLIMGSEGSIMAHPGEDQITLVTPEALEGQPVTAPALPVGWHNEAAYFISCIEQGTPPSGMVAADVSCDAQEILEAGVQAIAAGCAVTLPL